MVRRKLMLKVAGACVLGLCALSAAHRSLAADITWEQAKEILRSGEGLTGEPTLGGPVENPDAHGAEANTSPAACRCRSS